MSEIIDEYTANKIKRFWGGNNMSEDTSMSHNAEQAHWILVRRVNELEQREQELLEAIGKLRASVQKHFNATGGAGCNCGAEQALAETEKFK